MNDGSKIPSKIYKYSDIYSSGRSKGDWNITFIDLEGFPFAVKWEQTRQSGCYQIVNEQAALPFAVTVINGYKAAIKNLTAP